MTSQGLRGRRAGERRHAFPAPPAPWGRCRSATISTANCRRTGPS